MAYTTTQTLNRGPTTEGNHHVSYATIDITTYAPSSGTQDVVTPADFGLKGIHAINCDGVSDTGFLVHIANDGTITAYSAGGTEATAVAVGVVNVRVVGY